MVGPLRREPPAGGRRAVRSRSFRSSSPHSSASAHVAAQLGGVPPALQIGGRRPGWRARRAARFADLQPTDPARWQADVALVDLLLAPTFDPGSFLRRQILLDTSYMNAVSADANWRTRWDRRAQFERIARRAAWILVRLAARPTVQGIGELSAPGSSPAPVAGASYGLMATRSPQRRQRFGRVIGRRFWARRLAALVGILCVAGLAVVLATRGGSGPKPVTIARQRKSARAHAMAAPG